MTLQPATLRMIKKIVGPRGVSAFLNAAAEEKLGYAALDQYLDELDRKHGPAPAKMVARVGREMDRHFRKYNGRRGRR